MKRKCGIKSNFTLELLLSNHKKEDKELTTFQSKEIEEPVSEKLDMSSNKSSGSKYYN
jgi:hypothetical protein